MDYSDHDYLKISSAKRLFFATIQPLMSKNGFV